MERFSPPHGNLFKAGDTYSLFETIRNDIKTTISRLDEDYIINVPEHDYHQYLIDKYSITCPTCLFDEKYIEDRKVLVSPEFLPRYWGARQSVERNMFRLFIPFQGDNNLLRYRPSTYTLSGWSNFTLCQNHLYVDILSIDDDAEKIKREIASYISTLTRMLEFLSADIGTFNNDLPSYVKHTFSLYKEKALKNSQIRTELGIPLKKKRTTHTYSVPSITKVIPQPPKVTTTTQENLEPAMDTETYHQILDTIQRIGRSLEQYPETVRNQNEECIRALFLAQLNATFTSLATTGESFNHNGKTDIMIKHNGSIIFIAECKIWKGEKAFLEAINQLLSYLTWRDSKTSLLVFVKQTNISTIINTIKDSIVKHPAYICMEDEKKSGWLNYKFHLPGDSEKVVQLAVQIFDFK